MRIYKYMWRAIFQLKNNRITVKVELGKRKDMRIYLEVYEIKKRGWQLTWAELRCCRLWNDFWVVTKGKERHHVDCYGIVADKAKAANILFSLLFLSIISVLFLLKSVLFLDFDIYLIHFIYCMRKINNWVWPLSLRPQENLVHVLCDVLYSFLYRLAGPNTHLNQ